jgi:EmrB/QacA subfamily drug resistance transporter
MSNATVDRPTVLVAATVAIGMLMTIVDTTIVNVAIGALSNGLDAPLATAQWVTTGYLLALATAIPLTGWLSQRFGSGYVWSLALATFAACSLLCGTAWSVESLIIFRVLQGLGGGMLMPLGQTIVVQSAGPERFGRVMSIVGVPMLLAPVLGPVVGGAILEGASWRWIFYVNVPIAVAGLVMAARFLPPRAGRSAAARGLDWRGAALVSPGLCLLVLGLSSVETRGGLGSPLAAGPMIAGAVLLAAFITHAVRDRDPLIDVRLFATPAFGAAAAGVFLVGGALYSTWLVLPLYLQSARGLGALDAGLLLGLQGVGVMLGMPVAGRLVDRRGGTVALCGCVLMCVGTLPLVTLGSDTDYAVIGAALVLRGVGFGASLMPMQAVAYGAIARARIPRATTALHVCQRIGGSVSTALLAVVLQAHLAARNLQPEQFAGAFGATLWWTVGTTALALAPAAVLARRPRKGGADPTDSMSVIQSS